jgi:hypothetical protein
MRDSKAAQVSAIRGREMTVAQLFELLDVEQAATLLQWRFQKLSEAGHEPIGALLLAVRPEVDLRLASDLLTAARETRALAY